MKTIEVRVDTSGRRGLWDVTAACDRFAAEASGGGDGLVRSMWLSFIAG